MNGGSDLVEGEDFYLEGPYMVFTASYLKRRGYCCESSCRHCPWGYELRAEPDQPRNSLGEE